MRQEETRECEEVGGWKQKSRNGGDRKEEQWQQRRESEPTLGMNVALATICTFNIRPTMTTSASTAAATMQLPLLLFPPVSANSKQPHCDRFCLTVFHILAYSGD